MGMGDLAMSCCWGTYLCVVIRFPIIHVSGVVNTAVEFVARKASKIDETGAVSLATALLIASIFCLHHYLLISESLEMENKGDTQVFHCTDNKCAPLYLS